MVEGLHLHMEPKQRGPSKEPTWGSMLVWAKVMIRLWRFLSGHCSQRVPAWLLGFVKTDLGKCLAMKINLKVFLSKGSTCKWICVGRGINQKKRTCPWHCW